MKTLALHQYVLESEKHTAVLSLQGSPQTAAVASSGQTGGRASPKLGPLQIQRRWVLLCMLKEQPRITKYTLENIYCKP